MLLLLLLIIVGVPLLLLLLSRPDTSAADNQIRDAYNRGYWEGRRHLRQEVMDYTAEHTAVSRDRLQEVLDKSQWIPETPANADLQSMQSLNGGSSTPTASPSFATTVATAQKNTPADYAVLLLYLGAFLFVAAASLFVLFGGMSGAMKTLVVIIVIACFYGSGLFLNQSKRLRSVGATFAAIGLMLAPLAGIAVYGFWLNQTHGTAVWLVTSLACVFLYLHALLSLRHEYIGYLMIGTVISLVQSSFTQFGLAFYSLSWGLLLAAMVSAVASRLLGESDIQKVMKTPLFITATILSPVALVWSVGLVEEYGIEQCIITLYFAAIFHGLHGYLLGSGIARQAHWIGAQLSVLVAVGLLVFRISDNHAAVSVYLATAAVGYVVASLSNALRQYAPRHYEGVFALSMGLMIATIISVAPWASWLLVALVLSWILFWLQWNVYRQLASAILAQLALMTVPITFGWYVMQPQLLPIWVSGLYVAIAYCCFIGAYHYPALRQNRELKHVLVASYVLALVCAVFGVAATDGYHAIAILLAATPLAYGAAVYHREPLLSYFGHMALYIVVAILGAKTTYPGMVVGLGWTLLSILLYAAYFFTGEKRWQTVFQTTAEVGLVLAALTGLLAPDYWYVTPLACSVLAGILFHQSLATAQYWRNELGAALMVIALQTILQKAGVNEFLVYSHMWAGLFAAFAWRRYILQHKQEADTYTWLSLSVATIPFALLLVNGLGLYYGWIFITEHILIALFGSVIRKANVMWWGLCATVLAVLYQLRELQFIALGVLSLFVLGVAIYLTTKQYRVDD